MNDTKTQKRVALLLAVVTALVLAAPAAGKVGDGKVRSGSVIIAE
jgi:hypothetical protein